MSTRIAVLCSGGGTNLQALIDAWHSGQFEDGEIVLVAASRPGVYALQRAADNGIPAVIVNRKELHTLAAFDEALFAELQRHHVNLIVLAGFLSLLGPKVLGAYKNRILNVHPSLIPRFCGKGFYGLHVHKAVLEAGETVTGATIHLVDEVYDNGPILLQKEVAVHPDDTPESLQQRVMEEAEWQLLPEAVSMFCRGNNQATGKE